MLDLNTERNFCEHGHYVLSIIGIRFVWNHCRNVSKIQFFNQKNHQKRFSFHVKFSCFRNFLEWFQTVIFLRMSSLKSQVNSYVQPNISLYAFSQKGTQTLPSVKNCCLSSQSVHQKTFGSVRAWNPRWH